MSFRGDILLGRKIYDVIKSLGHMHTSKVYESDTPKKFYQWSSAERLVHYEKVFEAMHKADVAVLESTIHSLTIGQMIQDCIERDIPLLILVREKNKLAFLDGLQEENNKLIVLEYQPESIKETLTEGFHYLSNFQDTRFTMILPNHMIRFLDEINKTNNISKSEYIRRLIKRDMEER